MFIFWACQSNKKPLPSTRRPSSTVSNWSQDLEVSILQTENHPSFPSPYIRFLTNLRQQTTSIGTWSLIFLGCLINRCDFYYRNDPRQKSFLLGSRKSGPTKSSNSISQSSWTGCVQCDFNGSICHKSILTGGITTALCHGYHTSFSLLFSMSGKVGKAHAQIVFIKKTIDQNEKRQ